MERETLIIPARINAGVFRRFALYDTFVRQGRWRSPALFAGILGAAAAVCLLMRQRREGADLLGGVLLGVIEIFACAYISTQMSNAIVFAVLIVVLLVRPTGLLGKQIREKV